MRTEETINEVLDYVDSMKNGHVSTCNCDFCRIVNTWRSSGSPHVIFVPSWEELVHAADRLEHHDDGGGNARFNIKVADYLRVLAIWSK